MNVPLLEKRRKKHFSLIFLKSDQNSNEWRVPEDRLDVVRFKFFNFSFFSGSKTKPRRGGRPLASGILCWMIPINGIRGARDPSTRSQPNFLDSPVTKGTIWIKIPPILSRDSRLLQKYAIGFANIGVDSTHANSGVGSMNTCRFFKSTIGDIFYWQSVPNISSEIYLGEHTLKSNKFTD